MIGYGICYFVVTPILMNKHGKRPYKESYIWIANCLYAEDDLDKLYRTTGDAAVKKTIKLITICKYSIIANLLLFILFAVIG